MRSRKYRVKKGQLINNVTVYRFSFIQVHFWPQCWGVSCSFHIKKETQTNLSLYYYFFLSFQQHLIVHEISNFMGDCDYSRLFGRISFWISMAILVVASLSTWLLQIQRISEFLSGFFEIKIFFWFEVFLLIFQAFSILFVCIAFTSDLICLFFIPAQWLFFVASTYVWVQFVWHTGKF